LLRSLIAGLSVGLLILLLGPIGIVAALASGSARPIYAIASPAMRLFFAIAGVRLEVSGRDRLDPGRTYVFCSNHVSNADPPAAYLAIGRDIRALGKASLFHLPIFGRLLRIAGFVPVERGDREQAVAAVDQAAAALRQGFDFLVFGEGTRSRDGRLLPLKKGPFVMAIKAQVPVAPMTIRGTREVWPRGSLRVRSGRVRIEFLDPVETAGLGYDDREALRRGVETAMAAALGQNPPSRDSLQ
jgi:1-acyl-sn-glycerol-3-phosphate acyltransferase